MAYGFKYATFHVDGHLMYTNADSVQKHLDAITYTGMDDEKHRAVMRHMQPGVENIIVNHIHFMGQGLELLSAADKYCARMGLTIV